MSAPADPFEAAAGALGRYPALRAVNFHHTPHTRRDELEQQLGLLARRFTALDEGGLDRFAAAGCWTGERPPLVISFFNGLRDNLDVALPLLDRFRLKAWFFVPTGFVEEPAAGQVAFASRNRIALRTEDYPDGRHALSTEEMRRLADGGHAVAAHTRTHSAPGLDEAMLREEIVGAQDDMRRILGRPVAGFAFQSGAALGENPAADALLQEAGYRFLFSNLLVQPVKPRSAPAPAR